MTKPRGDEPVRLMVRLSKSLVDAVTAEAFRRAEAAGSRQPSVSAVVAEAVSEWVAKQGAPKKRGSR